MRLPVKKYTSAIGTIALSASLMVTISSSDLLAAECEISGLNIIRAYNRALNNGATFGCYRSDGKRFKPTNTVSFMPLPDRLQCFHKKEAIAIVGSIPWDYRMLVFSKRGQWPLNGWKISRYRMSGDGGQKIATRSGGIIFQTHKRDNVKWQVALKKFWLKKNGASCSNINAVISQAFGD